MKPGSTLLLRAAVTLMGLAVVALCSFILPAIHTEWAVQYPAIAYMHYPVLLGISITAAAFLVAVFQALRLLDYIDKNKAFSYLSIKALQNIALCGITIGGAYTAGLPLVYYMAQDEDAPGLIVIALVIIFASFVITTFSVVLQKVLQSAIAIKAENDLTV